MGFNLFKNELASFFLLGSHLHFQTCLFLEKKGLKAVLDIIIVYRTAGFNLRV